MVSNGLRDRLVRVARDLGIVVRVGKASEFRTGAAGPGRAARGRAFAYCTMTLPPVVVIAPDFDRQPFDRAAALLAHELAHAYLVSCGDTTHTERQCDATAKRLFGVTIRYDRDDVQTLGPGVTPRPARLG